MRVSDFLELAQITSCTIWSRGKRCSWLYTRHVSHNTRKSRSSKSRKHPICFYFRHTGNSYVSRSTGDQLNIG